MYSSGAFVWRWIVVLRLQSAIVMTCAAVIAFSHPASANPKSDCESRLQQAEENFTNSGLGRGANDKVRKAITNARRLRDKGKYKKCVAIANNVNKQLGTK